MPDSPPIAQFTPFVDLVRLMIRFGVDAPYLGRAAGRLTRGALTAPLRLHEKLRYGPRLAQTEISDPPIFILGYGRSGTTHLHNLFMQDSSLGCLTNYQSAVEPFALTGNPWMKSLMARMMPDRRPMDNVAITMDTPQEEEIAFINSTRHAALHFLSFPRNIPQLYDRYVYFENATEGEEKAWEKNYMRILKKATILSQGKRLVLKTPTNTARIPLLLRMFPDARFVHIVRNPYQVYRSMEHLYRTILPAQLLQRLDWEAFQEWSTDNYPKLMEIYARDREAIPTGQLAEITFEALEEDPLKVMEGIYRDLSLSGWEQASASMGDYLVGLEGYRKNRFQYPNELIETVNQRWSIGFEMFGYKKIPAGRATTAGR
jgi:hypothetical protein